MNVLMSILIVSLDLVETLMEPFSTSYRLCAVVVCLAVPTLLARLSPALSVPSRLSLSLNLTDSVNGNGHFIIVVASYSAFYAVDDVVLCCFIISI